MRSKGEIGEMEVGSMLEYGEGKIQMITKMGWVDVAIGAYNFFTLHS